MQQGFILGDFLTNYTWFAYICVVCLLLVESTPLVDFIRRKHHSAKSSSSKYASSAKFETLVFHFVPCF